MELIKSLGVVLADKINISPPATRGLIKLAIKDELGPFTVVQTVNLKDMQKTINNSLKKRLVKLAIQDVEMIIESLLTHLKENQSLITMANV
jgi:hypothetical protein